MIIKGDNEECRKAYFKHKEESSDSDTVSVRSFVAGWNAAHKHLKEEKENNEQ